MAILIVCWAAPPHRVGRWTGCDCRCIRDGNRGAARAHAVRHADDVVDDDDDDHHHDADDADDDAGDVAAAGVSAIAD